MTMMTKHFIQYIIVDRKLKLTRFIKRIYCKQIYMIIKIVYQDIIKM